MATEQQQQEQDPVVETSHPAAATELDLQFYKSLIDLLPAWNEERSEVRWMTAFVGGGLMGYGARMARGCTSGQALSGGAVMSVGS